eukprot:s373_g5.t1
MKDKTMRESKLQAAVRGRLPVRRSASKLEPDELANAQAPSAWISYQLILDAADGEMETTIRQQCAGRCMASGDGLDSLFLPPVKSFSERATHAERVALSSMLNLLSGANRVEGGVLLYTAAALCISCLAAFCHCKRLYPVLRFEISWDSSTESKRWVGSIFIQQLARARFGRFPCLWDA